MLDHSYLEKFGCHLLVARAPFELKELLALGARVDDPDQLRMPKFFDFRDVNLKDATAFELRKLIRARLELSNASEQAPSAFLVGDDVSFGMMRMYNTYAELEGLREEYLSCVTEDVDEAVTWFCDQWEMDDPVRLGTVLRQRLVSSEPEKAHA